MARAAGHVTWVAATTLPDDRAAVASGQAEALLETLPYALHLVDVDEADYVDYYEVVSNRLLWFAHHGIEVPLAADTLRAWRSYERVDDAFATRIAAVALPRSAVLLHDYHLALVPRQLRRRRDDLRILHFTHSPFADPRSFARLPPPVDEELVRGMLGADVVGFHVRRWSDAFLAACEAVGIEVDESSGSVEVDGRAVVVREYPIPVDVERLREAAQTDEVRRWSSTFASPGRRLIVRADRIEPAKNVVLGFEAFELLLARRRDLRDVRFVACVYGSRASMPEYRRYEARIHEVVERINARYGDVVDLYTDDSPERALGALLQYDVLLVNPLADGMNLVAKEGALLNRRAGALVLSRGAGAFVELGESAVPIEDATDLEATASALEAALDMPPTEREARAARLREVVGRRTPADWLEEQLRDLEAAVGSTPVTAA
jgi:trehalose 6-phosphate synthase